MTATATSGRGSAFRWEPPSGRSPEKSGSRFRAFPQRPRRPQALPTRRSRASLPLSAQEAEARALWARGRLDPRAEAGRSCGEWEPGSEGPEHADVCALFPRKVTPSVPVSAVRVLLPLNRRLHFRHGGSRRRGQDAETGARARWRDTARPAGQRLGADGRRAGGCHPVAARGGRGTSAKTRGGPGLPEQRGPPFGISHLWFTERLLCDFCILFSNNYF